MAKGLLIAPTYNNAECIEDKKIFLIFNTACFGDVLLCNFLCQNIKNIYNKSKIVFIVDKQWKDVAKYQECVDEVIVYDKKGVNKGLLGFIKFIKSFPYKNIFASVITYRNERNFILAYLLGSKNILGMQKCQGKQNVQEMHNASLQKITQSVIKNYPIKFNLPDNVTNPTHLGKKKYITLCCISKDTAKDLPLNITINLIKEINARTNYKIVLVGKGPNSSEFEKNLENAGCEFINFVNKTTILELGKVLVDSAVLISVDTGTMHYGYSLGVPTICLFFQKDLAKLWAPIKQLYNSTIVLSQDITVDSIMDAFNKLGVNNEQ